MRNRFMGKEIRMKTELIYIVTSQYDCFLRIVKCFTNAEEAAKYRNELAKDPENEKYVFSVLMRQLMRSRK